MPVCVPGLVVMGEGGGRGGAWQIGKCAPPPPQTGKPEPASPLTIVGDGYEDLALDSYM